MWTAIGIFIGAVVAVFACFVAFAIYMSKVFRW